MMTMKTVKDLINFLKEHQMFVLTADAVLSQDYMSYYNSNNAELDFKFNRRYRSLILDDDIEDIIDNEDVSTYRALIYSFFTDNNYKFSKLYSTLSLEYNPIENYNGEETEEYSMSESTSESSGNAESENSSHSMTSNLNSTGKTTLGTTSTTSDTSNRNDNVYGFNTGAATGVGDTYEATSESSLTSNSGSDLTSSSEQTSLAESNNSQHSMTASNEMSHGQKWKRTLKKAGNLGVTTTQQMIMSEREVAMFEFYSLMMHEFISYISTGIFA